MKKKNDAPTIAVLIPMHNAYKTIDYTIASLHNQTVKPDQIVIVDDCSDDASLIKARELCPEAVVIALTENVGAYHATMQGLKEVKCDYVVRCDSDDELTTGFIAKAKELLALHPYDIISMPQLRIDHNNPESKLYHAGLEKPSEYLDEPHCLEAFFANQIPWYITGKVIRTKNFQSVMLPTIPKKTYLDDVFMTMMIYAISHSFICPDTSEGYIYHYGIGYYSSTKTNVSFEWWRRLMEMRIMQWNLNRDFLRKLGLQAYEEKLFNACEATELFDTLPLLPCHSICDAVGLLKNFFTLRYKEW